MQRLLRLFHTARYLKPSQIFWRFYSRLYKPGVAEEKSPARRQPVHSWHTPAWRPCLMVGESRFSFLNETHQLESAQDWNQAEWSKLWLYNLHYFDDLNAVDASERNNWHRDLIARWIRENPPFEGNGWEPYPLSLRIVNWIKWALQGNDMESAWLDSLAIQVRCLRKRLEYHLLGNHLLANAKALVFAGLYFEEDEAEEWLAKGLSILEKQLPEQVLPDGGHFELSPMYHGIILEDLLDLINLAGVYEDSRLPVESWIRLAQQMRAWLNAMCHPDGDIGFFNDATLGIAPRFVELEAYASRLGLDRVDGQVDDITHLKDSGYIRLQNKNAVALLDAARVGPDYIPGHAHADTLSFELSLFGQRLIVNSGISCYGTSAERLRQRGTAAHSTVEIDGENSSEVWSGFRVARRARPYGLKTRESVDELVVTCAHDGYKRLDGSPVHNRAWRLLKNEIEVTDNIQGSHKSAVAYYHLHPDVEVSSDGSRGGSLQIRGGQVVDWLVSGGEVSVVDSTYHPGFGLSVPNKRIKVLLSGVETTFRLRW